MLFWALVLTNSSKNGIDFFGMMRYNEINRNTFVKYAAGRRRRHTRRRVLKKMAYRRRKSRGFAAIVASVPAKFALLKAPVKVIVILLPLAVAASVIFILSARGDAPALQASATDPPPEAPVVSNYVMPSPPSSPIPTTTPVSTPDMTLKKGDKGENVKELQKRLMKLGYLDIDEPTDLYGAATEKAVEWFQRESNLLLNAGLEQNGIADNETQTWLFSSDAKKYVLLQNTEGSDVSSLQRQLKNLGYLKNVTGFYGDETTEAVKKFQRRNNLDVDGKTGEETLECIYSPKAIPDPSAAKSFKAKVSVEKMIAAAQSAYSRGCRYVSGDEGPNTFDCSGLVYWCLKAAGSQRPRYNAQGYSQVSAWQKISTIGALKRGDLMFFWDDDKNKIGHVSIYIGGGMMIDASSSNGRVMKRSATSNWCKRQFRLGRRPWSY